MTAEVRPRLLIASYAERRFLRNDDLPLRDALDAAGIEPVPIVWDEARDWSQFDACLIRSTSDYHLKYEAFQSWLGAVASAIPMWNPYDLTLWNSNKSYLRDLAVNGIPTIPTVWLTQGTKASIHDLLDTERWPKAIVKPTIGLGSQNLYRIEQEEKGLEQELTDLLREQDLLVQPFLPSVELHGETSLIFIDGKFTHAVKKQPRLGDFRVQKSFGGTSETCEPSEAEEEVARHALECLDTVPLYARVDLVADSAGGALLIELELIEPDLFFRHDPRAATCLADALVDRLLER
jgi:glutathione synthase/RimK-type ligase-like ATP-grasp enzyme